MFSAVETLAALKYAGIAVAAFSTVWGLLVKTSFDDQTGQKRLTRAGHLALALVLGSSLISALSFGFETLGKQEQERAARQAASEKQAREDRREAYRLFFAMEIDRRQRQMVADIARKQDARQIAIANSISSNAATALDRANIALQELNRVLHPLPPVKVRVVLVLDPSVPAYNRYAARLLEYAKTVRYRWPFEGDPDIYDVGFTNHESLAFFRIRAGSRLLPDNETETVINQLMTEAYVLASFVKPGTKAFKHRQIERALAGSADDGDLNVRVQQEGTPVVTFNNDLFGEGLTIGFTVDNVVESWTTSTGEIASIPDLEKSKLVMWPWIPFDMRPGLSNWNTLLKPFSVEVSVPGYRYGTFGTGIRHIGRSIFEIGPLQQHTMDTLEVVP